MNILEIERFIRIIKQHWDYFLSLLSNISYQEINLTNVYNNKIIGPIRIGETNKLRVRLQTTNIVACSNSIRSIFTPENTLFAAVLLGINILASKFLEEGKCETIKGFKVFHEGYLHEIINFSTFLLKDRNISN